MSAPPQTLLAAVVPLPFLFVGMGALWLYQRKTSDAGVVDVGWSAGIGLLTLYYAAISPAWLPRRLLVAALGALWSFRLAGYLLRDRIGKESEDARYRNLREYWGHTAQFNFFWFFQAQALLILLFALPLRVAMNHPTPAFRFWDALGLLVWIAAVGGETLADRQLAAFRARPENKGGVCDAGLWRYSRHPNYFFEWVHWFAYVLVALGSPAWPWTWLGPVLMFMFLYKVTGIPHTEAQSLRSRGEAYRRYQQRTSAFFPWFPRNSESSP